MSEDDDQIIRIYFIRVVCNIHLEPMVHIQTVSL